MGREFVLVHGMSHGAWAWEGLVRRLDRDGQRAIAPDLPGQHGRRAAQYAARVTPIDMDVAHEPMLSALDDLVTILEKIPTEAMR
jgi:pimeloyl-ACP methyl ester carboxylesterase